MKPYGLIADCHLHAWSSFSTTDELGVNSRLTILLNEIARAAEAVAAAGGNMLVIAGDVFHVRGQIAPSVFNPTKTRLENIVDETGVRIVIMPGNHDMEFKESSRVGNAVTALATEGIEVLSEVGIPRNSDDGIVLCMPWFDKISGLKAEIEKATKFYGSSEIGNMDLIIHAPIDGVLVGIPDHGLTVDYLAGLGFKRVFAGHYHNHRHMHSMPDVYSIGAIAHHTWSDVGTRAGFLIVYEDEVQYVASHAPSFIDVLPGMDETEVTLRADGNYVRAKTHATDATKINELREFLERSGARGVLIQHVPVPVAARDGTVARAVNAVGGSLEASVGEFVKTAPFVEDTLREDVTKRCQAILAEATVL